MLGQKILLSKIDNFSILSLPHSILLLGERGSEQNEVCEYISNKFSLDHVKCELTKETVEDIKKCNRLTLFSIDMSSSTDKEQNYLLKVFEDTNPYAYVVLLSENETFVLDTIKTRSYLLVSDKYSIFDLEPLVLNKKSLEICTTPGQVEAANMCDVDSLFNLCDKIIESISRASLVNTLSIANKINFSNEEEKFDLYLFIKCLNNRILKNIRSSYFMSKYLREMSLKIWKMNNKRAYFELFLTEVWDAAKA